MMDFFHFSCLENLEEDERRLRFNTRKKKLKFVKAIQKELNDNLKSENFKIFELFATLDKVCRINLTPYVLRRCPNLVSKIKKVIKKSSVHFPCKKIILEFFSAFEKEKFGHFKSESQTGILQV